jgi:hypothetical protein
MNMAFDSETAANAMNSKFNPTTKKVILYSRSTLMLLLTPLSASHLSS